MSTGNLTITHSKSEYSPHAEGSTNFQPIQCKPKLEGSTEATNSRTFLFNQSDFHICRRVFLTLIGQN
jgi:hypothetical protein